MKKVHAVGMVVRNRWSSTSQALQGLLRSDQPYQEYDLFLIDNGSSPENSNHLKDFIRNSSLPVKSAIFMPEASISQAWNLFMVLARNYDYRTKMDNDMVLSGTISVSRKKVIRSPADSDPKSGAPLSGPPILGLGNVNAARRKRQEVLKEQARSRDSSFLSHMQKFSDDNHADLVSLVPITPEQNFRNMWSEVVQATWKGLPYLFGATMLISKKCFDAIGYFDERLPRRIDVDYSQRAIRAKLNIGYHDWYYAIHIGSENTEPKNVLEQKRQYARMIESQKGPLNGFVPSQWQSAVAKIEKHTAKNKILNLR